MKIRKAQIEDLPQLSKLFNDYRIFYRKETNLKGAEQFLKMRLTEKDSEIFIAEDSQEIICGFVQLYPLFSSTKMKKLWLLNDLFVDSSFRGKGISIQLIGQAKKLVIETKACGMFLETEKTNNIGNKLYPRADFKLNQASNYYEWNNENEQ